MPDAPASAVDPCVHGKTEPGILRGAPFGPGRIDPVLHPVREEAGVSVEHVEETEIVVAVHEPSAGPAKYPPLRVEVSLQAELVEYRRAAIALVGCVGDLLDHGGERHIVAASVSLPVAGMADQREFEKLRENLLRHIEVALAIFVASGPDCVRRIALLVVIAAQSGTVGEKLLDRDVHESLVEWQTVLLEEVGKHLLHRRRELELAVLDQRRDRDRGDRLRHAGDERLTVRVLVVAMLRDRAPLAADHENGSLEFVFLDGVFEDEAIQFRSVRLAENGRQLLLFRCRNRPAAGSGGKQTRRAGEEKSASHDVLPVFRRKL